MPGKIIKEECEPFDYVIKETGEEITVSHRWVFAPEDLPAPAISNTPKATETLQPKVEQFSQNGVMEYV